MVAAAALPHMLGFNESKYLQWVNWVHAFVHDKTHELAHGTL
jgi:hypothetical protein